MGQVDLSGVQAKLDRAEFHIETLRCETAEFIRKDPQPWTFRVETEPCPPNCIRYRVKAVIREPVQPHWALIVGDALHNLRGSLDYLLWQMTRPRKRGRRTYFPIYTDQCEFQVLGRSQVEGVYAEHRAFLEGVQPYHWRDNAPSHPLFILKQLSNFEKHQLLLTITTGSHFEHIGVTNADTKFERLYKGALEHDTEIMSIRACPEDPSQDMEVNPGLDFQVGLKEVGNWSAIDLLKSMHWHIKHAMCERYFRFGIVPSGGD